MRLKAPLIQSSRSSFLLACETFYLHMKHSCFI
nr:MAG TPA: hypothetical protein [Caudoviricetes sp.]